LLQHLIHSHHIDYNSLPLITSCFFSTPTSTTGFASLSLHDALPISALKMAALPFPITIWLPVVTIFCSLWRALLQTMCAQHVPIDRKSTRLNSSHVKISYAVFCLKKKIQAPVIHNLTLENIPLMSAE